MRAMLHPNSALSEQVAEFIVLLRGLEEMESIYNLYIVECDNSHN